MVARQLTELASEACAAIREENFGLAKTAWIEEDFARGRIARMVLVVDSQLEVSKGNPGRFTAPARMDNLAMEGEQLAESRARVRCVLLFHAGDKIQGVNGDT